MAEETSEFKIAVIGRSGVGKSRVVSSFLSNNEGNATEGPPGNTSKKFEVQGKEVTLHIIDTAETVQKSVYKEARGIMVVYDITDKSSFDSCTKWLQEIDDYCQRYPAIAVIGNKSDLEDRRMVSKETLEGFAMDYGVSFMEVSGKTGKYIRESFNLIAEDILYENEELKASEGQSRCCSII